MVNLMQEKNGHQRREELAKNMGLLAVSRDGNSLKGG
jgi:hypothetical protein